MARTARKVAARKAQAKGGKKGRTWNWRFENTYVRDQKKWSKEARLTLPAPKDTVRGCIFAAISQIKSGSDEDVLAAAIKLGLEKLTKQSVRKQVQMKLRRFARHGVIVRIKNTKKMARKELRAKRAAERAEQGKTTAKSTPARAPRQHPAPAAPKATAPAASPAPAKVTRPRASAPARPPVARPATRPRKAPAKAPAPAVPPAPAAPNPANPPRPRPVLRAKPKPAPAPSPAPAAAPAPAASPVAELLAQTAACAHTWEEQPGEPPRDVCTSCGAVRE